MKKSSTSHTYADNRKARFDYEVIEEFEAGLRLYGEEVKSVRGWSINLRGSYILITKSHPTLVWVHISEYPGGMRKLEPKRERDLLMKQSEIARYESKIKEMWATLIPMEIYSKGNLIKVRVALVKGRKKWEKKQVLKERDIERETALKFRL